MAKSFSVRVVRRDGQPRQGVRVAASFGWWDGTTEAYTDSDGWAVLEFVTNATAEIYVYGKSQGRHSVSGGETFSFTVDP